MEALDERLALAAKEGPTAYYRQVLELTQAIHQRLSNPDLMVATLPCKTVSEARELLPAAVVLNDCTAIEYLSGRQIKLEIPEPRAFPRYFGTSRIELNVTWDTLRKHGIDPAHPTLSLALLYDDDAEQAPLLRSLHPFIETGHIVFRPHRAILARQGEEEIGKRTNWHLVPITHRSPLHSWTPKGDSELSEQRPVAVEMEHAGPLGKPLFEVTIPFLRGVPMRELHRFLTDEGDLVFAFRSALKATVRQATKDGLSSQEMVNDLVRPKLSLLERKFRSLQRVHGIRVGGAAMASVALVFTAVSTAGPIGGILAAASAGGIGLLGKEVADYNSKSDELCQDPYYFLWKCKRIAKRD